MVPLHHDKKKTAGHPPIHLTTGLNITLAFCLYFFQRHANKPCRNRWSFLCPRHGCT